MCILTRLFYILICNNNNIPIEIININFWYKYHANEPIFKNNGTN